MLGTNTVQLGSVNGQVTVGMTNQWHFYVLTNNALDSSGVSTDVTNAVFITFDANPLQFRARALPTRRQTPKSVTGMKSALVVKPDNVTFEQAASAPVAALTALQGLRDKARIEAGQKVLVNGAAGGVGTFTVQIARSFGANVTGVCSTRNVDLVRSIGADQVIDYTQQDCTKSGQRYDIVLDCVGNHSFWNGGAF